VSRTPPAAPAQPRAALAAYVPLVIGLACLVGSVWLDVTNTDAERAAADIGFAFPVALPGLVLAASAAWVLRERPGDRVGLVLGAVAVVWSVDGALSGWLAHGHAHDSVGTDAAFWFVARFGAVLLSGLVALLLLYPTGRLLGGRWRPLSATVLVASFALPLMLVLAPDDVVYTTPVPGVSTELVHLPVTDGVAETLLHLGQVLTLGSIAVAVALLWVRHRHADPRERTQIRWLLWAGIMCVLLVLAGATLSVSGGFTTVLLDVAVITLAASLAVGLLRPGLGDVDALVAWTLTTAVVAAIVIGIDLAVLAAGTALLGDRLDQRDVTLVVLVLAVVVYGPLRGWLGGLVHRLLLGRRNDRYRAVSALAARLETIGTVDEQLPALASAVADTFKVRYVRVEVLTPDGGLLSASHGTPPAEVQEIDIAYQDERIGRLVLPVQGYRSMLSRRDQGLLVDLVRQAAVAIRARLLATELQASRERLVLGREDDRRRIRRDLHDGLGPVLGGVALRLQAAGNAIDTDPARARELVALARTEVSDALDDVRRLVHDLRPPALDDLGLEAAVRQQADRVRSEVDVDVTAEGATGLPAAVEVAAYRIVSEALANVVKHAGASHVDVRLEGDAGGLTVTVADDGRGIGPDVTAGVGLLSLRERAEELGGRCEVVCPESGGTTVRAVLPYGAAADDAVPPTDPATTTSSLPRTEPVRSTR
jgi:signal transduction histidine kinase